MNMLVRRTKGLIKKIANLTMCTFHFEVVFRDFCKVKLSDIWKIGHITSDYRSGHEGKYLGKDKGTESQS
jgi:hypothetical protein